MNIVEIVQSSSFIPTNAMIRRRGEFWRKCSNPDVDSDTELKQVIELGASSIITRWWSIPGFREWFLNKDWNKHEAEALLQAAMKRVADILRDEEDTGLLINAAKEARAIYAQMHVQVEEKFADSQVAEMSKDELAEYIRRNTRLDNNIKKAVAE